MQRKEDFLKVIHWQKPEQLPYDFGPLAMIREPGAKSYDEASRDVWGVTWGRGTGEASGRLCVIPGNEVITDVTRFREQLVVPDIHSSRFAFEVAAAEAAALDREEHLVCLASTGGLFERAHFLMGFEDCLTAFLLEPEAMDDLLDVIADYKIRLIQETYRCTHFDAIFFHDDWGSKTSLFFSPETWREHIKPRHQRIVEAVKSLGDVIFIHHSDTYLEPLVPEMAEMGIDVWQGCIPQNDIVGLQKNLRGKIAFMGGIEIARIDRADSSEEEIRQEVRRAVDTYAPGGGFIPGIPSGSALYPQVQKIIQDELKTYTADYSKRRLST